MKLEMPRKIESGHFEMTGTTLSIIVGLFSILGGVMAFGSFAFNKNAKIENATPRTEFVMHLRDDSTFRRADSVHHAWQDSLISKEQRDFTEEAERGRALNCWIANNPIGFCDDIRQLQRSILQRPR